MGKRDIWREGWGDDVAHHNLRILKNKNDLVITETVTKTVGAGKDFETLHEALKWLETIRTIGPGYVYLSLDDGTHTLGGSGTFNEDEWSYYVLKGIQAGIGGASGDKTKVTITLDAYDDGDNWPSMFALYSCHMFIQDVTIDTALGGYPYAGNVDIIMAYTQSSVQCSRADLKNGLESVIPYSGSIANYYQCVVDNFDSGLYTWGGRVKATQTTISNCDTALYVSTKEPSIITMDNCTLTANTADSNVPLHEIQYSGSYITNLTSALSFKA